MKTSSIILLLSMATALSAQTVNTSVWQVGFGGTHIIDTYLSQEKFSGTGMTLLTSNERQRDSCHWSSLVEHELNIAGVEDRAGKCEEMQGSYTLFFGRMRQWQRGPLLLQAGAMGAFDLGAIYNTGNSNNPAQARLSLQLMPAATAAYTLPLFHRPLRLRYEVQLPLLGVMFSPNYGQSYYEIFSLDNYDHNIVPTTFVSAPNLRHQLSVDYPVLRRLTLRLGYLGHYQQARVNNLKSHVWHHRLMIGVVRRFSIIQR
jgi:hypothetical protein